MNECFLLHLSVLLKINMKDISVRQDNIRYDNNLLPISISRNGKDKKKRTSRLMNTDIDLLVFNAFLPAIFHRSCLTRNRFLDLSKRDKTRERE